MTRETKTKGAMRRLLQGFLIAGWGCLLVGGASALPRLTIEPITFDVIGLDSNKVASGPNTFEVGARVTNTGTSDAVNVIAQFVWDSANPYVSLDDLPVLSRTRLGAGAHEDFYFRASVQRTAAAYNTTRRYHIEVAADGLLPVSTPIPRQLYVERLVSMNRSGAFWIEGPMAVYMGRTYQFVLHSATSQGGGEQLTSFVNFPNTLCRVISTAATYTVPKDATNDKIYADACGWDPNPLSPTYRQCVGPPKYKKGKAGGDIVTVYTVQVTGSGQEDLVGIVVDLANGTYHYCSNYGQGLNFLPLTTLPAPLPGLSELCYLAPATGGHLAAVDADGFYNIGAMGASNLGALAMAPGGEVLYGANGGQLGTIDTSTGVFTSTSSVFGTGNGAAGPVAFNDVDGLTFDPLTLKCYGANTRTNAPSVLFQINPATGAYVPGAFGSGVDYVVIAPVGSLTRIEDISVDPADGQMYGVVCAPTAPASHLVRIDVATGGTTDIGALTVGGIKGLSFSNDSVLRGTTGSNASLPVEQQNYVWIVNKVTAEARPAYAIPTAGAYEGLACLTSPANTVSGTVFRDDNRNADLEGIEPGLAGAVVRLYVDVNGDGALDPGDRLIQTTTTAADGTYSFSLAVVGKFIVAVDRDSVLVQPLFTTPVEQAVELTTFGATAPGPMGPTGPTAEGEDVGAFPATFEVSDPILWGDTGVEGVLETGDTVAFEVTVTNVLAQASLTVNVKDSLPTGLADWRPVLIPAGADVTASTAGVVSVRNIVLPPDSSETILVTALVCGSVPTGTILTTSAEADWNGDGVAEATDSGSSVAVTNALGPPASIPGFCAQSYTIMTVAGTGVGDFLGDNVPADTAKLYFPAQVALDPENNLYIADRSNHVVRKVDKATKTITTVAGIPHVRGYSGDTGPALQATLALPSDLAVHGSDLYVAEMGNHVIRKIDLTTGIITTVAGNGTAGFSGDGGPATSAQLNAPRCVLVDVAGNIYIGDTFNFAIRRVDAVTKQIDSIAGTGVHGNTADGQPAKGSPIEWVHDLALTNGCDGTPVLYFVEQDGNNLIRRIVDGKLDTFVGRAGADALGDCGPAGLAGLKKPYGIALDSRGNLYIADMGNHKIRMVDTQSGLITTIAGTGTPGYNGDSRLGLEAHLNNPTGVAVGSDNLLYIVDKDNHRIRCMDLDQPESIPVPPFPDTATGLIDTVAGTGAAGYNGDGADSQLKQVSYPGRIVFDAQGNLIVADRSNHRVRKIYTNWTIATVAGTGVRGYSGNGSKAVYAQINFPTDVAAAADGSLYISDQYNHVIRKVDASGTISTVAGTGTPGFNGDGTGTAVQLNSPDGLALYGETLYISDWMNHRLRALNLATGDLTTVAGTGIQGKAGEYVDAKSSPLDTPQGLDVNPVDGTLYIAERGSNRIRCLTTDGVIHTVAGDGIGGFLGDGGSALVARLSRPMDIALGPAGELYIAEYGSHIIRRVDAGGVITTYAGKPLTSGYQGDGGAATAALLNGPMSVAVTPVGDVFLSDRFNHAIRVVGH